MQSPAIPKDLHSLPERLRAGGTIVVLSGSGMSAESGIPTFRDAQTGIWSKFRPQDLATPQAFARNPGRVWNWYESRRASVLKARPHAGYEALAKLETMLGELTVVTQNVDGLHQRSGAKRVLELHGNILRSICSVTRRPIDDEWLRHSADIPPRSPHAPRGLARPDVVWFGEALPEHAFNAATEAVIACSVCLCVGTAGLVEPAASLPLLAKRSGAYLVEINPHPTPLSPHADVCLRQPASAALIAIARACGAET